MKKKTKENKKIKPLKLRSFEEKPSCSKCGKAALIVKYIPKGFDLFPELNDKEHLSLICKRCGFSWLTETKGTK